VTTNNEGDLFEIVATTQNDVRPQGFNAVECRAIVKAIIAAGWRPPVDTP
jgi:hypothetical protein